MVLTIHTSLTMSLVDGGDEQEFLDVELFDEAGDTDEQADVNTSLDCEGSWTLKRAITG